MNKQIFTQYYIDNYEIDNARVATRMYLSDVTHDGAIWHKG